MTEVAETTEATPLWRRLTPVPWRGPIAGLVAAAPIVGLVSSYPGDRRWLGLYLPIFVVIWMAVSAVTLWILRARPVLAIATLSLIPSGSWAAGIPYFAGTSEWNVAVLVTSAGGVALAEWELVRPSWIKLGIGAAIFVAGVLTVHLL